MPVVSLTISRTNDGSQVADLLAGGATGLDLGTCVNGAISSAQTMRIRHNGTEKITGLSYYIQPYSNTYGGNFSAGSDYSRMRALGDLGGGDYGLQVDEDFDASPIFTSFFKVRTGFGDAYSARRTVPTNAMLYVNGVGAESIPSATVVGQLGVNDQSVGSQALGNRALLRVRLGLPTSEPDGGIRQWDFVFAYVYTN